MLTVRRLVAEPALALRVVGGAAGLERPVRAAHVSELLEPGPWLHGGEVLMTLGLLQPTDLEGARRYVRHCRDCGVAAVIVGLGPDMPFQSAPEHLAQAADEEGLPVIEVPDGVPFIAVTEWILNWLAEQERQLLRQVAAAGRNLSGAAVTPTPLPDLLNSWYTATGESAVVLDLAGAVLAQAGGSTADLVGLRYPLGTRQTRGMLLIESATGGPGADQRSAGSRRGLLLPVLIALLSLHLEHQFVADRPARIQRAHVVAQLVRAGLGREPAARLAARVGLTTATARVVVVRPRPEDDLDGLSVQLTAALPGSVARPRSAGVELIVPDPCPEIVDVLTGAVEDRATGIGDPVALEELSSSCRQAHALLEISRRTGRPAQVGQSRASALLLQLSQVEVLAAVSAAVLAPLDALPEAERGDLLDTLQEWLQVNGVWEAAAARLGVHRNTIRNRIAKIAALTGRSLEHGDERYELWLALRARAAAADPLRAYSGRLPR